MSSLSLLQSQIMPQNCEKKFIAHKEGILMNLDKPS